MYQRTAKLAVANLPVMVESFAQNNESNYSKNAGIIDLRKGMPAIELWPVPLTTDVSVTNPNTVGATDVTAFIFNENTLKNSFTDNYAPGVADADRVVVKYNDGFKGKLIDRVIQGLNGGRGLLVEELTIIGKDATGAQSDAAILALDAAVQSYNAVRGTVAPINIDLGEAIRNTAYKNGMVTVKITFWVNLLTQFAFLCKKGYSYELKFKWAA